MKRQLKFESPTCRKPKYTSQVVEPGPAIRVLIMAGLMVGTLFATSAWASEQPPRWIEADDLRVRAGPGMEKPVVGVLQRGTQVILKTKNSFDGYCLIEGDGQYGYVACQYLSDQPVARPRAGQGGVPADRRWITGTAVNMRIAPVRDAQVVTLLAINRTVRLLKDSAGAGYCGVQPLDRAGKDDGPSGFTACRYLGVEPLSANQAAGWDDDPIRGFWRSPDWWRLSTYAEALDKNLPESAKAGPWPRDEQLERMKAHLALGLKGPIPTPLADWAALKALAAAHDPALLGSIKRAQIRSGQNEDLRRRQSLADDAALRIYSSLGLPPDSHDPISSSSGGGGERVLRLMQTLELPRVRASLFRSEFEVGPPGENIERLAGRFDRIYRTVTTARRPNGPEGTPAGLYDMLSRTESLTRPVQFVRLYRDGTLRSEPNIARRTTLIGDVNDSCEDWTPGFAFGDADGPTWNNYVKWASENGFRQYKRASGPARLFGYNALQEPPRSAASRTEQLVSLGRYNTGFVRFNQLSFDIDGDGEPDLVVLEGSPTDYRPLVTDYRLLVANIGGAWKVLGYDTFSTHCGC